MALDLEDVRRIADLARVAIDQSEAQAVLVQLNGVLRLIAEMRAVDTSGVEPMAHALDITQRLREDSVTETDQRALFQSLAPHAEGGLYLVPKVIE
jgi:aspartyl-tRNA(Asn)/glutamyl-tRNA(Gln) amidotransferase subunit C